MALSVGLPLESVTSSFMGFNPWPRNDTVKVASSGSSESTFSPSVKVPSAVGSKRTTTSHVSVVAAIVRAAVARLSRPCVLLVTETTLKGGLLIRY